MGLFGAVRAVFFDLDCVTMPVGWVRGHATIGKHDARATLCQGKRGQRDERLTTEE